MRFPASRRLVLACVALIASLGMPGAATSARGGERAVVVVELFTSQGCSSCPLADEFLRELAKREDIVPLAFHVDYWDHLGWKDPYARPDHAKRQRAYVAALGARYVYTPQMVVDGRFQDVGSNRKRIEELIDRARSSRTVTPAIAFDSREVTVAAGAAPPSAAMIWAVYFVKSRANDVPSGENRGRNMATTNVVRGVARLGPYDGTPFRAALDPAARPADSDGVAIVIQTTGYGPVLSARLFEFR